MDAMDAMTITDLLAPRPMSPAEVAELVDRVRINSATAGERGRALTEAYQCQATTRSRCAARYSRLVGCSLPVASREFAVSQKAVYEDWRSIYPGVPTHPRWR
jgi:hypothetical protein